MMNWIREFSKGDNLSLFWRLFLLRGRMKQPLLRQGLTFLLNRMAHRRGGYIGAGAGRMCMDQLSVDITDIPDIAPGDIATLIGRDGLRNIRVEELAWKCGTILNELLSRLGSRPEVVILSGRGLA